MDQHAPHLLCPRSYPFLTIIFHLTEAIDRDIDTIRNCEAVGGMFDVDESIMEATAARAMHAVIILSYVRIYIYIYIYMYT